ncbi:uncharacterized protein BDW47DRAFT_111295 [Aspergillus candidus]|uniref:Uncharacterized protein n=1 Tax=Aspergillus candidus TaxID=41067 RepID=A0A2I2F2U3_ASPCN|nr:hypothetical protein BDW47DRAFT_111295 [Aspergillus candidus]PLB34928.1 hypothetical protein BDW47DRAFT_111295 [Aspergillus candidus]
MGLTISPVASTPVGKSPIESPIESPPPPNDALFYEEDETGHWTNRRGPIDGIRTCSTTVIFASGETLAEYAQSLLPTSFLPVVKEDLNGTFVCDYDYDEDGKSITRHDSWSCFKIKMVPKPPKKYYWVQPAVLVQWDPKADTQRVWFINLPPEQEANLTAEIPTLAPFKNRHLNPYMWHSLFATAVLSMYKTSFWFLRDIVRAVEKARNVMKPAAPDFHNLHDIARHIFHSTETLQVAEATLTNLRDELSRWRDEHPDLVDGLMRGSWMQTQQKVVFAAREITSARIRSQSLTDRLQNEINLAFNLVSQRFGKDAQSDSAIMKTIGVVSLVYLPGTFVSGVFGTNFFDMDSLGQGESTWAVSSNFWLYWAVTVPLTLVTVMAWALWHFYQTKTRRGQARMMKKPMQDNDSAV